MHIDERIATGRRTVLSVACGLALAGSAACGADPEPTTPPPSTTPMAADAGVLVADAAGTLDGAPPSDFVDGGPSVDGGRTGCAEGADLVYITGAGGELWTIDPPTLHAIRIGKWSCAPLATHMTIDRHADAWFASGGRLYRGSTKDATCAPVPTWTPRADFPDFALAFAESPGTTDDTLYVMGPTALAAFDPKTGALTIAGPSPVPNMTADMTSSAAGTLYLLEDKTPPTLYDLDPKTAAVISKVDVTAVGAGPQGLAFWGGGVYAFESNVLSTTSTPSSETQSGVYRYDPSTKTTARVGLAPIIVTGAGQSPCVPKVPPPVR